MFVKVLKMISTYHYTLWSTVGFVQKLASVDRTVPRLPFAALLAPLLTPFLERRPVAQQQQQQ